MEAVETLESELQYLDRELFQLMRRAYRAGFDVVITNGDATQEIVYGGDTREVSFELVKRSESP